MHCAGFLKPFLICTAVPVAVDAGVAGYTEQYFVYANGGGSHYIDSYDNYSEQQCANQCTRNLDCESFEWRDPAGANGPNGNCKTAYFNELDGPGLEDSNAEEWNFYEQDEVVCADYPDISDAVIASTGTAKGDLTVVTCDDGFFGGGASVCQADGQYDQMYSCYGTSSDVVIAGTDCSWRAEEADAPGTFETGVLDALPTYWLEEPWNHAFCWTGAGLTLIATSTTTKSNCKVLCDGDGTCTGATYDGTDCNYYSGPGSLTACAAGNYGYQQASTDFDSVGTNNFAHCGDKSLVYTTAVDAVDYEWVFVGCFDQENYFKTGDSATPSADTPAVIFAAAEAVPYQYAAFAYVDGNSTIVGSEAVIFSDLWKSASDALACRVPCAADSSYFCGDESAKDEFGLGGWAVYIFQPVGVALNVVSDGVTAVSTFDLYSGQSYVVHYWALVARPNSTFYPPGSVQIYTRIGDSADSFFASDVNVMQTAFEWVPMWHDMFTPGINVASAALTIGAHTFSDENALYIDDVIVYCVSCCYPEPDFFLPDRMYFDDETGQLGKLASESGFWNKDVSSVYTTAVLDSYVTQVCATATAADESSVARIGLALSYRADEHPIIGGNYVLELGLEGVASAYNFEAEPSCGCWAVHSGINVGGGNYKTNHDLVNAPSGIWQYGAWVRVSSDWDGSKSVLQARWYDDSGSTITTTSTGPWVLVNNNPVYGEWVYVTKNVNLNRQPALLELYLGAPGFNSAGAIEVFSVAATDPTGHDWLKAEYKSSCGDPLPGFDAIDGNAAIVNVTCEEFMSPFWTQHKLEGVDTSLDAVLYSSGDRGCVTYVQALTYTQSTEYTGNSWDFYNSCNEFCTSAGSTCVSARYRETGDAVECELGPVPDILECKCADPLIVFSVTTNDGYDVSLNVGTSDDQIVTGGSNADSSYALDSDEECMVLCRDIENCLMFEFYEPSSCMMYTTGASFLTETCLGRYSYSSRKDGGCTDAFDAFDSADPPNDAKFDAIQEIITDDGYTAASRTAMDTICEALCDAEGFACLGYGVADDTMFASSAYVCELYSTCNAVDLLVDVEHFTRE